MSLLGQKAIRPYSCVPLLSLPVYKEARTGTQVPLHSHRPTHTSMHKRKASQAPLLVHLPKHNTSLLLQLLKCFPNVFSCHSMQILEILKQTYLCSLSEILTS